MSDGGRNDTEYELSYERVDGSEPRTVYGKVTVTEGEITGLTPFTVYIVSVSAENGVSSLATDATGRTATVTITTTSNTDEGSKLHNWCGNLLIFFELKYYKSSYDSMSELSINLTIHVFIRGGRSRVMAWGLWCLSSQPHAKAVPVEVTGRNTRLKPWGGMPSVAPLGYQDNGLEGGGPEHCCVSH